MAAAVSTVNFALRTPAEQDALTAAYGRWLNSLTGPVQILIRAGRADLSAAVAALRKTPPRRCRTRRWKHAALDHAAFLGRAGRQPGPAHPPGAARHPRAPPHGPGAARRRRPGARRAARRRGRPAAGRGGPAGQRAGRRPGHRPARRRRRPRRRHPRRPARRARPARHQPGRPCHDPPPHRCAAAPRARPDRRRTWLPGPPAVEVAARHVRIGDDYAATLAVTGYPAEVGPGLAGAAAVLPRPPRRRPAHRADPAGRGRRPAAPPARPPGIRAPAPAPTAASSTTRTPRPPPTTPATWPTGSPAARASCSASACT